MKMPEVELLGFLGHVFGAKSSGCVATFTLRHHVDRFKDKYGDLVVDAVKKNFYVDDLVKSLRDVATAATFRKTITAALKEGGFELCKWRSSHPGVLESDDAATAAPAKTFENFPAPAADTFADKILGMCYSYSADAFSFQPGNEKLMKAVSSKRDMLKVIAALFDPMGYWVPSVHIARVMFQLAVRAVKGWNDADRLPAPLLEKFAAWQRSLVELARLSIPRWTSTPATRDSTPELHVFSDASAEGYGAVAYRRVVSTGGEVHVAIVFAKAHVVPIKVADAGHHESIPRLELQAARLAAEVYAAIVRESGPYGRIVMWTDSECVIKQLRDRHTRFKMYFANRISKIQALTDVDWWRYVPSADNPADDCSRGLSSTDPKWARFHNGPGFLWGSEDAWPQKIVVSQLSPADILAVAIVPPPFLPPSHWALRVAATTSSWTRKLQRVAAVRAVALAMLDRWRRRRRGEAAAATLLPPTLADLDAAKRLLLAAIQRQGFGDSGPAAAGGGGRRRAAARWS